MITIDISPCSEGGPKLKLLRSVDSKTQGKNKKRRKEEAVLYTTKKNAFNLFDSFSYASLALYVDLLWMHRSASLLDTKLFSFFSFFPHARIPEKKSTTITDIATNLY